MNRCLTALAALILCVCLASCGGSLNGDPAGSSAATDAETAAVVPTQAATETQAPLTEPPETQAPTEYTFRWDRSDPYDPYDATGFVSVGDVIPDAIMDIRYYSEYNFVGKRIDGYEEPIALLSEEAAYALKNAADELRDEGYRLIIYDAYRPRSAVDHFVSWASDSSDTAMKEVFYPDIDKSLLFDYGYIAYYSGHSRGSKVDMSLADIDTGEPVDMGGGFDYFSTVSHPDYTGVSEEQYRNRMTLRNAMLNNGFSPCATEWWDFTLNNEPYPSTYFNFPVSSSSLVY
ncbi:MAG: M15 family metallopeptidase [Ruminococcus sp.]|uniref:M15 family metallopeptidase n=1 Tax=Ruminococcus sp. TaxID=41978 RepID=UPI002873B71A|nr:M15 family metallopeptidase [Ruminococcus sp.]MBQ3285519.1 M15 family metallopeptidase [Ruminococcus sp.]